MIEVEVKVSVKNREQIKEKLNRLGFIKGNLLKESDYYFDNCEGCMRKNDKALRIRSCENFSKNRSYHLMTFKGPKMDKISMTRKEVEMELNNSDAGTEILRELGYEPVFPVIKTRQYFHKGQITACLDQVEHLGEFLELENVVELENEKEPALDQIIFLLKDLGYEKEEIIRTSYLSMLQKIKV